MSAKPPATHAPGESVALTKARLLQLGQSQGANTDLFAAHPWVAVGAAMLLGVAVVRFPALRTALRATVTMGVKNAVKHCMES